MPTAITSEMIGESQDILRESIKASNRLSQVMDYQAESLPIPRDQITPPLTPLNKTSDNGTTPHNPEATVAILSQAGSSTSASAFDMQGKGKGKELTHGHGPSSFTTAIVPRMSEFEKSIAAENVKQRAESDNFIRSFAAKQQGEKLLSCKDPWFVHLLAEFKAQQAAKLAAEKEVAANMTEDSQRLGDEEKKGKKMSRGKGFKGWLISIW